MARKTSGRGRKERHERRGENEEMADQHAVWRIDFIAFMLVNVVERTWANGPKLLPDV